MGKGPNYLPTGITRSAERKCFPALMVLTSLFLIRQDGNGHFDRKQIITVAGLLVKGTHEVLHLISTYPNPTASCSMFPQILKLMLPGNATVLTQQQIHDTRRTSSWPEINLFTGSNAIKVNSPPVKTAIVWRDLEVNKKSGAICRSPIILLLWALISALLVHINSYTPLHAFCRDTAPLVSPVFEKPRYLKNNSWIGTRHGENHCRMSETKPKENRVVRVLKLFCLHQRSGMFHVNPNTQEIIINSGLSGLTWGKSRPRYA